ncbi:MAG: hypothetical protein M3Q68_05915, partial [Actinomycetota bacterium]|nr:hypothetical protein [Actinomycetota bacterium]
QRLIPTADGNSRVPATEVLVVNGRVQSWIMDADIREDVEEIIADGDYYGMHSFDQSILDHYAKGTIDLRAALAASSNPHDLSIAMRLNGLESGRGAAELRGSEVADTSALQTLVQQLNDDTAASKVVEVADAADAEPLVNIEPVEPLSDNLVKPRRTRRTRP